MEFEFSKQNLSRKEQRLERIFEILPGLASWSILIAVCNVAWWQPIVAAVLIIAFDFYWLLRLFYMTLFLILAYLRLSLEKEVDWMTRIRGIDRLHPYLEEVKARFWDAPFKQKISLWIHRRKLAYLKQSGVLPPPSNEIYHLVIFSV